MATPGAHQPTGANVPCARTPPNPSSSIPILSPRTPRHGAHSPTPESDSDDDTSISLNNLPKGHLLVVRGCVPTNHAETPVSLVQDAITNIGSNHSLHYLIALPILVSPFHERVGTKSSACYIKIKLPAAGVTAVRSYPLDQDLVNRFGETVDDKSDVYRLPDIKDESVFWI
ncbi:hypothetical protein BDZ94DRAFT_640749 [Collybia nuda]|uniref:Uncharacterized protein n=1 Tax=Collybia nuda TaxID=64659 RepID=A0A9P6CEN1_9AGAR|nr:hypothetical protein BDZ94DRAFT_640749 [Collybia nuda]